MPRILVTRKLPSSVISALESAGTVDLHADAAALSAAQLRERLRGADAVVSMLNDQFDRATIDAAEQLKIIANVAVGYNNIDVDYAHARGVDGHQHAGRADRLGGRLHLGADSGGHATARRGRSAGPARRLERVGVRLHARHRPSRASSWGSSASDESRGRWRTGRRRSACASRTPAEARPVTRGGEAMSLDRLLNTSDVVSLHVPLAPETQAPDRQASARAHEAVRVPDQHGPRPGGRRGRARVGPRSSG